MYIVCMTFDGNFTIVVSYDRIVSYACTQYCPAGRAVNAVLSKIHVDVALVSYEFECINRSRSRSPRRRRSYSRGRSRSGSRDRYGRSVVAGSCITQIVIQLAVQYTLYAVYNFV